MRLKFWQKPAAPTNIYAELAASIAGEADTGRTWCTGSYYYPDSDGNISACLVGHVDLTLGTAYVKDGNIVLSADEALWTRRHRIVNRLATLISPNHDYQDGEAWQAVPKIQASEYGDWVPVQEDTPLNMIASSPDSKNEGVVTGWNDGLDDRGEVVALVKQAAELYPND